MSALMRHTPERGGFDWPDVQSTHEIVQPWGAGVGSTLPAGSIARTSKRWSPGLRPRYVSGLEQAVNAAPSSLHSKVDPASFEENEKLAPVSFVGLAGAEEMVVFGAVVSTVTVTVFDTGDALPALSFAVAS
jgi:hypothetical protein